MSRTCRALRLKADSVVPHGELDGVARINQRHGNIPGRGVIDRIRDGFVANQVQGPTGRTLPPDTFKAVRYQQVLDGEGKLDWDMYYVPKLASPTPGPIRGRLKTFHSFPVQDS